RHARQRPPAPVADHALHPATAAEASPTPAAPPPPPDSAERVTLRRKPPRRREPRWDDCLVYPCRALPLVVGLGLAWAVWAACSAVLPPVAFAAGDPARPWIVGAVWLLATLALAGYTAAFLDCGLVSAAAGEVLRVRWPGGDLLLIVRSLVRWLF